MTRGRRLALSLVVPLAILAGMAFPAFAAGGPASKAEICHFANHKFVEISVSTHALPAHLAHGDVMPDQYGTCP
jgi:hypothetical protein